MSTTRHLECRRSELWNVNDENVSHGVLHPGFDHSHCKCDCVSQSQFKTDHLSSPLRMSWEGAGENSISPISLEPVQCCTGSLFWLPGDGHLIVLVDGSRTLPTDFVIIEAFS